MEDQLELNNSNSQSSFSIKDFFYKYVRFLPLFIVSVVLALVIAFVYLRYATPTFNATGSILLKEGNAEGGNTSSGDQRFNQMFLLDNSINIQNEIEVLRSRPLMEKVVRDLNLNFYYYAIGNIREVHAYKEAPFAVEAITY